MMKGYSACVLLGLLSIVHFTTKAQESNILTGNAIQQASQAQIITDTIPSVNLDDKNLNKIVDIRSQFEKQNKTYSAPSVPNESLLRFLKKDELELSEEALYWAHLVRDASTAFNENMTFKDTIIVNPLFMPIVFKGEVLPKDLNFFDPNSLKPKSILKPFVQTDTIFKNELLNRKIEDLAYQYVQNNYPTYFRYSLNDLPKDVIKPKAIKKTTYEDLPLKVENEASFSDVDAPVKFIPERRYWISHFESAIQFAQNYISPNWHKGGVSTLNLTNRQYFVYNYNKDKIQFTNELEWKTNLYTAPKDTLRDYKIGDDVFRVHSNFGYRAFNKWYYTFDATFQTQLFSNYQENTNNIMAALLAPFSVNLGLGMKYDLNKKFANKRHKNLTMSINLAPLSYTFMYSIDKDIDLGRHGFKKDEATGKFDNKLSQFGSTVNATATFQFNRNVSWYSRFYYFTSYDRILGEFENRLTMAISRFFSTTISLNLRYDDAVAKNEDFDSYLQINELLSFGFNYKW